MPTEANSINAATTGIVGNTGTAFTGTAVTQYNVIVGGSTTSTLSNVAPAATSGVPLISQGASSNPAFGTAVVAGGGTGATSFSGTNGAVITGSTSTSALSSVALANQKFLAGNTSAAPTAKGLSVVIQTFTTTGTYTPTSGMLYCIIQMVGGGGGGGSAQTTGAAAASWGDGGSAGEYASGVFSAATVGASQSVTIGAAGSAGSSGGNGGNGGNTSVGALISANGGSGGAAQGPTGSTGAGVALLGGTGGSGGSYRIPGGSSFCGVSIPGSSFLYGGKGGTSQLGVGGIEGHTGAGGNGLGYGAGGGGASIASNTSSLAGGAGAAGVVIVTEYVLS